MALKKHVEKKKVKKKSRFFRSLRFRMLILLVIIGIVPCIVVGESIIAGYENRAISLRTSNVRNQCDILCNLLIKENYLSDPSSDTVNAKLEVLSNVYSGRILVIDKDFRVIKDTYNIDENKFIVSSDIVNCFRKETPSHYSEKTQLLQMALPIQSPEVKQIQGVMLVSFSTNEINVTITMLRHRFYLILGCVGVVVILLGFVLSMILVKPLSRITKSIEDITDGFQRGDITVRDYTETEQITGAFNKVLNRMQTLDESRQEFVSNVSHELKTPLTSMKILADSLVGQQGMPEELYQEFMQDITQEIDRETKIITDLLSLVKMDKKAQDLIVTKISINELVENVLKRLQPIAEKNNVELILDSFREIEADADEVKLTLAISNLVENGIKYNVDNGWVRVTLDADHKFFYVTVNDSGVGIPEDAMDRIFERFYRVDKSHSKEIGGTGLGLAITRSAIVMHHGVIKASSTVGKGTEFSVRIPLSYIAEEV